METDEENLGYNALLQYFDLEKIVFKEWGNIVGIRHDGSETWFYRPKTVLAMVIARYDWQNADGIMKTFLDGRGARQVDCNTGKTMKMLPIGTSSVEELCIMADLG